MIGTTRRQYSQEFKREAVKRVTEQGIPLAKVARDLDLNQNVLRRWKQELGEHGKKAFPGQGTPSEEELMRARRKIEALKRDREILKSRGYLLATPALKYAFITQCVVTGAAPTDAILDARRFSVREVCRALDVAPSAYYAAAKRAPSSHTLRDEELKAHIREIFQVSCGSPRVHQELQFQGIVCSEKRIAQLMQSMNLVACQPRRFVVTDVLGVFSAVIENTLSTPFWWVSVVLPHRRT